MDSDEARVARVSQELHSNISTQLSNLQTGEASKGIESLLSDLHQFQPCPQLLDQHLDEYVDILLKSYFQGTEPVDRLLVCEVFYTIGKIIGVKRLLSYMKTEIELIPFILSKFENQEGERLHWHEEYLLVCCLIVLTLIPFDLNSFGPDVARSIYDVGVRKISELNSGPLQPLGSRLIGSVVSRSDCGGLMDRFVDELICGYEGFPDVVKCGYLQSLNISLQKDANELKLIDKCQDIYQFLKKIQDEEVSDLKLEYLLKIYSKLTRYFELLDDLDTIDEIIEFYENNFSNKSTQIRSILSRNFTKLLTRVDDCLGIDIMIDVLHGTKKLFENHAMEVIDANLLHTELLIIAEIVYRDLLDGIGLKDVNKILSRTLFFQQIQITYISGANIRDASNYIIWALARSSLDITPDIFMEIFGNLLLCCCFDKELMIRRSSTAALQELVGRRGSEIWDLVYPEDKGVVNSKRNVDLLQVLDFIELGSIGNSYLNIPLKIINIFPDLSPRFIEFLRNNILQNLDHELVKLSAKAMSVVLKSDINENQQSIEQQISLLTQALSTKPYNSFIGLSEILPLSKEGSYSDLTRIYETFNAQRLDHHRNSPFVMESYIQMSYTLLKADPECQLLDKDAFFANLFDLIRVDTESILQSLKSICPLMELSAEYLHKWLYYMKNNNSNTSSTVSYVKNFPLIIDDTIELLEEDNRINSTTKTQIIDSMSSYLQRNEEVSNDVLVKLVQKLDDYTVSEQGDVGSKIRNVTVLLISKNFGTFQTGELKSIIEPKLLRLAAEPIDSLRFKSIELLIRFKPNSILEISDFETRNTEQFFNKLFEFYKENYINDKELSLEFWKGYTSTGGALRSTNELIVSNLRAFIRFYSSLCEEQQTTVLLRLAAIVRLDAKEYEASGQTWRNKLSKLVLVGSQFIARVFQLNVNIPDGFNIHGLYVRIYNIHLNTTNLTKISNAIKIFGHLYLVKQHEDSLKRLCWLCCNHTLIQARLFASEELFTVYKELNVGGSRYDNALQVLADMDWGKSDKAELKSKYDLIYVSA